MAKKSSKNRKQPDISQPEAEKKRIQECIESMTKLHQLQGTLLQQLRQTVSGE